MSKAKVSDPAPDELALLPLDKLAPSGLNPRKTFEPAAIEELAKSIREKGVLEPIIARPREVGYQIVAGERRVRAARLAGLQVIPAIVRDLDDLAAAEVAVIENDQRVDVPPLEQAEGYEQLIRLGDDAETIAAKIGRPVKYVVGRLQLTHLVPELQEDLRAGKLPFGHALVLAKLPAAEQTELRKGLYQEWGQDRGKVVTITELKRRVRAESLFVLSAAPWKWDDEALVPEAGSCAKCRKRSGNNPTLFDDLMDGAEDDDRLEWEDEHDVAPKKPKKAKKPPEVCTDGACYQKKRTAFVQLQLKRAGGKTEAPVLKVSKLWHAADKEALTRDRYEIVPEKDAKKAEPGELQTAVIVEGAYDSYSDRDDDQDVGRIVQVRVKKESASGRGSRSSEVAERRKKAELGKHAAERANLLVSKKTRGAVEDGTFLKNTTLLKHLAHVFADSLGTDACRVVANRRKLPAADFQRNRVTDYIETLDDAADLLDLLAELAAAHESFRWSGPYYSGHMDAEEKAFWAAFGVNRVQLFNEAKALQKEKSAPKAKPQKPKRKAASK